MAAIRAFRPEDAEAIAAVTLAAIRETALRAYSPEQVAAWAARHPSAEGFADRWASGHVIWVAYDEEETPLAYALMEPDGHLDMLYCHPAHVGRGLAAGLLAAAEAHARRLALPRLYTEASELARPVFAKAGYTLLHRRDFAIPTDAGEVPIHNYAMEKRLG